MKKLYILIVLFFMAGGVAADVADGTFSSANTMSNANDSVLEPGETPERRDYGWFSSTAGADNLQNSQAEWTRPDVSADYTYGFLQAWSDTLSGDLSVQLDITLIDIGDLTTPELVVEILDLDDWSTAADKLNVKLGNLGGGDTSILDTWTIDLSSLSTGTVSGSMNFGTGVSTFGIRINFKAATDGGTADNLHIDNVVIGSATPPAEPASVFLMK